MAIMRQLHLMLLALLLISPVWSQSDVHASWDAMLQQFVSPEGKVNYKRWKAQESRLDTYLKDLSDKVPSPKVEKDQAMAFWINAYNAFTVKLILSHYPLKSIMDLDGGKVWDRRWIDLGGKIYSLNDIEHRILREKYQDPRIHFAVNCAASSCPPLWNRAFSARHLESELDQRASLFINNEKYNRLRPGKVSLSRIFDWYRSDFGNLGPYLNKYSRTKLKAGVSIDFLDYDWALNE